MTQAIEIAKKYFELSDRSDISAIADLFTECSTYSSVNTGVYLGRTQIMEMMTGFHNAFSNLKWEVNSIDDIRPGVVEIDFIMRGTKLDGSIVENPGTEYIIVHNGKLQHVEVRNK